MQELTAKMDQLSQDHSKTLSGFQELEREHEDLLVCLADQDLEIQNLKERLRAHGEVVPDDEENVLADSEELEDFK